LTYPPLSAWLVGVVLLGLWVFLVNTVFEFFD